MIQANTKRVSFGKRLLTAAASLVMLATCAVTAMPVHAANTPVAGPSIVTFKKYLVLGKDANVPQATFEFQVTVPTASQNAIDPGITPEKVVVSKAEFVANATTTTGKTVAVGGTISDNADYQYAEVDVTADFSNVTFDKPGVYRYQISEKPSSVPGIVIDPNVYNIDIEVTSDDDGILSIGQFGFNNGTNKVTGFVNTFNSTSLTLTKNVEGNQGDRNKDFTFTVTLTNAPANSVYDVTLPTTENHTSNPTTMTVGVDGTVTKTFYLKDEQSIVINGLTANTLYTITEEDYSGEGYTTTNDKTAGNDGKTTGEQTKTANAETVTFTNTKNGTVPTGILLDVAPYIALVVIVAGGLVALMLSKKRRSR